jgi:tRNA threonylcarbamoyladenosine biosynthesis protein TsaB
MLAIEMSQRTGGVALRGGEGTVHLEALGAHGRHDDVMLPAVDRLVRGADLAPGDIEAIGISIGPGGFTGLRIAVSAVKMLALTLGARVVAVPSALVAAEGAPWDDLAGGSALVALAAKRSTFWETRVARGEDGTVAIVGTPGLRESSEADVTGIAAILADEFLPDAARRRAESAGVPVIAPRFDPAACLAVAERMLADGAVTDARALVPLYPREPEAVTVWRQRRGPA